MALFVLDANFLWDFHKSRMFDFIMTYMRSGPHEMYMERMIYDECPPTVQNAIDANHDIIEIENLSPDGEQRIPELKQIRDLHMKNDNDYRVLAFAIEIGAQFIGTNDSPLTNLINDYRRRKNCDNTVLLPINPITLLLKIHEKNKTILDWKNYIFKNMELFERAELENICSIVLKEKWSKYQSHQIAMDRYSPFKSGIEQIINSVKL